MQSVPHMLRRMLVVLSVPLMVRRMLRAMNDGLKIFTAFYMPTGIGILVGWPMRSASGT